MTACRPGVGFYLYTSRERKAIHARESPACARVVPARNG